METRLKILNLSHLVGRLAVLVAGLGVAACSSGSDDSTGGPGTGSGRFQVLSTEPADNGTVFLNQPLRLRMSNPVDLATADFNSISFLPIDVVTGNPVDERVSGRFQYGLEGVDVNPRILEFVPRLPTNSAFDNGGFRPGRKYVVTITSSTSPSGAVLKDTSGRTIHSSSGFNFFTPRGTSASTLFLNTRPGGPRVTTFRVTPSVQDQSGTRVPLNFAGELPVEIRLTFDQSVNGAVSNVPSGQNPDPALRLVRNKGRVFLEYDDVQFSPPPVWIPAVVDLERNEVSGAEVVLRPDAVLPNNCTIRVVVESTFEDISGESNVSDPTYERVVGRFTTVRDYESQFAAVTDRFDDARFLDTAASYVEPSAVVVDGALRPSFAFEGTETRLDFEPQNNTVLNTDSVLGGVYMFRNITIRPNVTVTALGSNPLVFVATGQVLIQGQIRVDGGNGQAGTNSNSAHIPTNGGVGVCGGGNGGRGSPDTLATDLRGEPGFGAFGVANGGGSGGTRGCGNPKRGSGGGGGSFAMYPGLLPTVSPQGDALWHTAPPLQASGVGGNGALNGAALAGGVAGPLWFLDDRPENDFFGAVTIRTNPARLPVRVPGELTAPRPGTGGGAGGDNTTTAACDSGAQFRNDFRGGAGGGGGGVVIIKALGRIKIETTGRVTANGGHGGGGERGGSNDMGGGGGGGSGGMVILESGSTIEIAKHGGTYRATLPSNANADFAISADGGVGLQVGTISPMAGKYPTPTTPATLSGFGAGGFGGMGVVQLIAPPGKNLEHSSGLQGTLTAFDDNIHILQTDNITREDVMATKRAHLGWRGFLVRDPANAQSLIRVDENGLAIAAASQDYGGDIRPEPIYANPSFSFLSRARSRWIYTGATARRDLERDDGLPRGIVRDPVTNLQSGPDYFFSGINGSGPTAGYVTYDQSGRQEMLALNFSVNGNTTTLLPVGSVAPLGASQRGTPAHLVQLTGSYLGSLANAWSNYRVRIAGTSTEFRVLGNSATQLYLDPADGDLPATVGAVEMYPKFFVVKTDGVDGLGPTNLAGTAPLANVQIGFAFHKDPANPLLSANDTLDDNRFPREVNRYLYDLKVPGDPLRRLHYENVQYEVLFNLDFNPADPTRPAGNGVTPNSSMPTIDVLSLPYRF